MGLRPTQGDENSNAGCPTLAASLFLPLGWGKHEPIFASYSLFSTVPQMAHPDPALAAAELQTTENK
jgi:hypothetical protein